MTNEPRYEDVERRAYELYEQRGREDGHDWDDWLQAEREVRDTVTQGDATDITSEPRTPPRRRGAREVEFA